MTKKNILITGATGFIGKNLVEKLKDKYNIIHPSHKVVDLLNKNNVDSLFKTNKIDVVIHCASQKSHKAYSPYVGQVFRNNMQMFYNIIDNKSKFEKMIHLSSGAVYDSSKPVMSVKETSIGKNVPDDEYGYSKYIMEKYIEGKDNDKVISLRVFGVYGKHEDYSIRFISKAICRLLLSQPVAINKERFMDFVYVNDLVDIIDKMINLKKLKYKSYNITNGDPVSLSEIIDDNIPVDGSYYFIKGGLDNEYTGNNKRLMEQLPKFKFTDMKDAIMDLTKWYSKQLELERLDAKRILEHY